jgi:DNA-binding MarR family transcriptional regulator
VAKTENAVRAWESLFRAQVAVMRRLRRQKTDVSLRDYDVLYNLSRFPLGLRLRELNEHILLDQSSLSRLVERLEAEGLLTRSPDPADRRATVVRLTEEGLVLQRRLGRAHAAAIARYVGDALDEDELRTLRRLCDKLRAAQRTIPD